MKLSELADIVNGRTEGNADIEITGVGKIETATSSEITFISNPLYEKFYESTNAGAIVVSNEFIIKKKRKDISLLRVDDPYLSFLKLLEEFEKESMELTGISGNSFIDEGTEILDNIYIGNFVSVGKNCSIGSNTQIMSNTVIENNVIIGSNCRIYPNVTIYKDCKIGNNVTIHAGTVIGSDGFGYVKQNDGSYKKIPQTGIALIEDNVEIGANCTIDRATLGETKICRGVKLDNQIQIAHNVIIGENTAIAAQVGIAGSAKIGKRCMIGGQSGIVGHIIICDDVIIGASVGVSKSITESGVYLGYRAKPKKESLMTDINIRNIGKLEARIKELENKISKSSN